MPSFRGGMMEAKEVLVDRDVEKLLSLLSPAAMSVCWENFNVSFKRLIALAAGENTDSAVFAWEQLAPEAQEALLRQLQLIVKMKARDLSKQAGQS